MTGVRRILLGGITLCIVLTAAGCAAERVEPSSSSSSAVEPSSSSQAEASPQPETSSSLPEPPAYEKPTLAQPSTKLQNAAEAGALPQEASLDMLVDQQHRQGMGIYTVLFPSEWPLEAVKSYIPRYPGSGHLILAQVRTPKPTDDQATVGVGITVYAYRQAELDDYFELLRDAGYTETIDPPTSRDMEFIPNENILFRKFIRPDATLLVVMGADSQGEYFDLVLTITDREAAWEQSRAQRIAATGTALQNAEQAGRLPDGEGMNQLLQEDKSVEVPGLTTRYIGYPPAWPADKVGEYIPPYTGDGWLFQDITSSPDHSSPLAAQSVTIVIYDYDQQQLLDYLGKLLGAGYVSDASFDELADKLPQQSAATIKLQKEDTAVYFFMSGDQYGLYVDINILMGTRQLDWLQKQTAA